jgi:hypothetical protein
VTLPDAPATPLAPDGTPAFGAYQGMCRLVSWDGLHAAPGPVWRFLHHKKWHYVSIAGPDLVFALAVVNLGWVGSAFAYVFDRKARELLTNLSWTGLPPLVADRPGDGALSTATGRGMHLRLERPEGSATWKLHVRWKDLSADATLDAAAAAPTLCAVAPIEGGIANCTHKTPCLPAKGTISVGERSFALDGHTGALDHTVGLLARDTRWKWVSAAGPDLALNLVSGFNGPVENAVWRGGVLHKVGAAEILYEPTTPSAPWRIRTDDDAVDLVFTPEGERSENKDLVVAVSRYVQPFGTFRGKLLGEEIDGLVGVTEDHVARW